MYIGLKQIQNQLTDYPTLLTSSDGIHALTGWSKLQDAPQPLTIHLLYTCVYYTGAAFLSVYPGYASSVYCS